MKNGTGGGGNKSRSSGASKSRVSNGKVLIEKDEAKAKWQWHCLSLSATKFSRWSEIRHWCLVTNAFRVVDQDRYYFADLDEATRSLVACRGFLSVYSCGTWCAFFMQSGDKRKKRVADFEVNLGSLHMNTLKRYKKFYKLTDETSNKNELTEVSSTGADFF